MALAVALVGACRPDRTPVGPTPRSSPLAAVPVRGHLVRVERTEGLSTLHGELVAAGPEGLWLWTGSEALLRATGTYRGIARRHREDRAGHVLVPTATIRRVVVSRYNSGTGLAITGGWTGGLVLLTISHGFLLVFTMPAVVVAGAGAMVATHVQSKAYVHRGLGQRRETLGERLSALRGFARFPQGVPAGWPRTGTSEDESEDEAEDEAEAEPAPVGEAVEDASTSETVPEPAPTEAPEAAEPSSDPPAEPEAPASEVPEPPAP